MATIDTASSIDFTSYITERTRDFTGREWVFQAVQAWLADSHGPRFFLLTGDPGSGKTSIVARLAQFSQGSISLPEGFHLLAPNFLSALHFCSARDRRWINPTVFAESLALQFSARYQLFAKALAKQQEVRRISIEVTQSATNMTGGQMVGVVINKLDLSGLSAEDVFTYGVREPLEMLLGQEPDKQVIVMVDALDEALTYSGDIHIVSLLAQVEYLPPGARFILTSRKVEEIEHAFRKATRFFLSSQKFKMQNQEDIDHYVERRLLHDEKLATKVSTLPREQVQKLVAKVTKKAIGNFLYMSFLLDAITRGQRLLSELEGLPEGLDGLYFDSLERVVTLGKRKWRGEYASLMGVLSVAQESLTQTQLAALTGQTESDIWEYLGDFQQFLEQVTINMKEREKRYRLYHQSVVDFLNQQWITVEQDELRNTFYCSMNEWHRKVANRCEQGGIMHVWEEERHDFVQQSRREYARKYYITHLFFAQAWPRLFKVLDTVQYGQAKIRDDPSTRSYALDLDLGRQATMWEGWTVEEGIAQLPHLWQYTLLRCSLTSRADRYPEEAFRLLILLGRKQEALGLAELLTNLFDKAHVLQHIAKQLREQAIQDSEWLELLMRAVEVVRTIQDSDLQTGALQELSTALAQAGQWAEAERVIGTIQDSDPQAEALNALGTALAQAGQQEQASRVWAEAERVIDTIQKSYQQAEALRVLGTALAQAGQWEHASQVWAEAERVIGLSQGSYWQAEALRALATEMANAYELEQLMHLIRRSWRQVKTREEALTLFPIVSAVIYRKPEVGIPFFDAFTWVDTFLGG